MTQERRRYFRINDTIRLSYKLLDAQGSDDEQQERVDVLDLMSEQDEKIERLLIAVADESPKVAALVRALNQKLERIVSQLVVDSRMVDRLAKRVREVNISACGVAFVHELEINIGARLALELELAPNNLVKSKGFVVEVEPHEEGFYWRIDFYDMPATQQERLIQHIVQRQSAQLKRSRDPQ